MAKRIQKIYWNMDKQRLEDSDGNSLRNKDQYPYIYYKEKPTIELHLLIDGPDSSGEDSSAAGLYQRLASTMWFSVNVDDDYDHDDSSAEGPLCKVTDGDIDESSVDTGILSFTLDGDTVPLSNALGTDAKLSSTYMEVLGYDSQMGLEFVTRIPFHCKNIQDPSDGSGTPASTQSDNFDWYTDGNGRQCLRILNDDGQILADLTP